MDLNVASIYSILVCVCIHTLHYLWTSPINTVSKLIEVRHFSSSNWIHRKHVSTPVHVIFADNLVYRAGSARIPFNDEVKQDSPYDIPRDHHERTLYAIPRSIPASSISGSTYFTNISSHSETVTSAPYSYFVQTPNSGGKKPQTVMPGGSTYDKPRGHMIMLEKGTPTNTHGNPEYMYMESASETTDGDAHSGGNYNKTMSEVCCHRMNFRFVWVGDMDRHGLPNTPVSHPSFLNSEHKLQLPKLINKSHTLIVPSLYSSPGGNGQ